MNFVYNNRKEDSRLSLASGVSPDERSCFCSFVPPKKKKQNKDSSVDTFVGPVDCEARDPISALPVLLYTSYEL